MVVHVSAEAKTSKPLWWAAPLLLAIVIYLALSIWLAYTKAPWCDEGWFANPAYNLAFRGNMGTNVLEPSGHFLNAYLQGIQQRTYLAMPFQLIALAGWFRVFGSSAFSARLYSICWGAISLPVLFYILRQWFPDRRVAVFGTLLTAIDFIFLWSTADARMEAAASALALCSLAAYLHFRERNFQKAVVWSQALGACAVFNHPNAALVVVAVAVLAWRDDRNRLRQRPWRYMALAAAPYLLLAILWSFYIWQSPADFKAQFFANAAGHNSERLTRLIRPDIAIGMEIVRHLTAYYLSGVWSGVMHGWMAAVPFLYLPAVIWFLRKARTHAAPVRTFVAYFVVMVLGMTFLNGFKGYFYLIYLVPFYNAVLAAWLLSLWERRIDAKCVAVAIASAFVVLQLAISILHIRADERHRFYEPTIQDLVRYRAEGKSIAGTAALGFGLGFEGFTDDSRLGIYTGRYPDVLVIDRAYRSFVGSFGENEPTVFEHVVGTLSTQYKFVVQHGPFWVFERVPTATDGKAVPWADAGNIEKIEKPQRAKRFFERVFSSCEMSDPAGSAL
jgi:Dolichyl-phosphate-mannose-protein mannosyltransferase